MSPLRWSIDDFPAPPQPFVERQQLDATLSYKDRSLDVEVVLDWDVLGRSAPHGWILGNNDTYKAIEEIGEHRYLPRGILIATADGATSATADITSNQRRGYEKGPTGIVASFACRELTFRYGFDEPPSSKRLISFFMAGPDDHWGAHFSREVSYTGSASVEAHKPALSLDIDLPCLFETRPHFFYSRLDEEDHQACARVLSITVTTEAGRETLPDEEFVRTATGVIDDASLLVSFLSGSWVTWYGYYFATGDRLVEHFRHARHGQPIDRQDIPIDMSKTRDFLKIAVGRLRQLRAEKREPRLALLHAISAAEATSIEEQFTRLFIALESLTDLHAQTSGHDRILPERLFAKVRRAIRAALEALRSDEHDPLTQEQRASMERKLPELNRRAFAEQLEDLLREYDVQWRDLYPPTADLPRPHFIRLRDKLLHTGAVDSQTLLGLETIRLQGLVERVLLRMLGWEDTFSAPRPRFHTLIRTKVGDESNAPGP